MKIDIKGLRATVRDSAATVIIQVRNDDALNQGGGCGGGGKWCECEEPVVRPKFGVGAVGRMESH